MKKMYVVGLVAGMIFAGAAATASAAPVNLVVNGDFGLPVYSNASNSNGWTTSLIDGSGGWLVENLNPSNKVFVLNHSGGGGSGDPTAYQVITGLTPGATYRLTGDYRGYHYNYTNVTPGFSVDVDDVSVGKFTSAGGWASFAFDVVAPDTDLKIGFRGEIDSTDYDFAIDNISLSPVPIPGAVWLLGCGLAGLVGLRRRNSHRV